ncbi:MAG: hypothetical protein JWO40_598 [Candidatus Doudnabacteria bacterium]|nr:hypothetical protein [Candidatus Doudnabacteria bacterium]
MIKFLNKLNGLRLATIVVGFVFGFSASLLLRQTDLANYNYTPVRLYNQYKKAPIDPTCPVKGKASKTKKTYHLPGDSWYAKLKDPTCFADEAAAQAQGFVKAKSLY